MQVIMAAKKVGLLSFELPYIVLKSSGFIPDHTYIIAPCLYLVILPR